jgi:hypothetical protein
MDGVSFTGKISIPNTLISGSDKYVGGLVGEYTSKGELKNSSARGDIAVKMGAGTGIVGGLVGRIRGSATDSRCMFATPATRRETLR